MNKQDSISSSSSAGKQKDEFKKWLYDKQYKKSTIGSYISKLNTVSQKYGEVISPNASVFEITDYKSFETAALKIKADEVNWREFNGHNTALSAIKLYDEFLGGCLESLDASSTNNPVAEIQAPLIDKPRNLIVFGAPGTGKSYFLNDQIKYFKKIERVTFYPSYSYSQFVGCYKPVMNGENISYSFVPGPFLRTYVDAVNNPSKNYLLIIEEINRAD
ncbi:MAG: hypothetical protein PUH25_08680, partial [Spirochaetales bacterium]|nr:hypothetical protein [Spirochaetales bacterium]